MGKVHHPIAALSAAILLVAALPFPAADKLWTGAVSTDWFEPNNWNPSGVPAGDDAVLVYSNRINLSSNVFVHHLVLGGRRVDSAILEGIGNLTVTNFTCTNGFIQGAGEFFIPSNGVFQIEEKGELWLHRPAVHNDGYVIISRSNASIGVTGTLSNRGTIEIRGNRSIGGSAFYSLLQNTGLILKSGGDGTNGLSIPLVNRGEMRVLSGTLRLPHPCTNEATMIISEPAAVEITSPGVIGPSSSFQGLGTLRFVEASGFIGLNVLTTNPILPRIEIIRQPFISFNPSPAIYFGSTTSLRECALYGGTLSGSNTLAITNLIWTEGALGGGGTIVIPPSGKLLVSTPQTKWVERRALVNEGTVEWQHGAVVEWHRSVSWSQARFNVTNYGLFNLSGDGGSRVLGDFLNYGTVLKSGGTGTAYFGGNFTNYGRVEVQSGALAPADIYFAQQSGEVILNGGNLDGRSVGQFRIYGGKLEGTANISGHPYYGNLINVGGNINPGSPIGTLTVAGYDGYSGFLNVDIGGVIPGVDHDILVVTGEVQLLFSAALRLTFVNGFKPKLGDRFEILRSSRNILYPGSTGFSLISGTDLGDGLMLLPQYGATNLVMVVTNALPNPLKLTLTSIPGGLFRPTYRVRFHTPFPTNYVVQASSTLTDWIDVSKSPGPVDFIDLIDWDSEYYLKRFYRLRWGE